MVCGVYYKQILPQVLKIIVAIIININLREKNSFLSMTSKNRFFSIFYLFLKANDTFFKCEKVKSTRTFLGKNKS